MIIAAAGARFKELSLEKCLDLFAESGVEGVEIAVGGFQGAPHVDPDALVSDDWAVKKLVDAAGERDISIVAVSCHGNPLHPDPDIRETHRADFEKAVKIAVKLETPAVVCLSGCPGTDPDAKHAAWFSSAWPMEAREIIKWQWEREAIPYWKEAASFATDRGIHIAVEMHPSNLVYNPATLLLMRNECGDAIGANVDPSHLFWQGVDPAAAVKKLDGVVYHVHAKDTVIDYGAMATEGCLDAATVFEEVGRTWKFAVPGDGHHEGVWRRFISALKDAGYDGPLSIEHEARGVESAEGLRRAVVFLKMIMTGL